MINKFSENLIKLAEVDSTNEEAFRLALKFPKTRLAVVSDSQTAGKGRMGRFFLSEAGQGLFLSLLESEVAEPQLTARVSVCVCSVLRNLTGLNCEIKWPNDIQVAGKKLCGILCEMRDSNIVIGIGINLNNTDFGNMSDIATSLKILGISMDKDLLLKALLVAFDNLFDMYNETKSRDLAFYTDHSSVLGKDIILINGDQKAPAKAVGFTEDFELLVLDESGFESRISSGEISLRLRNKED